MAVTGRVLAGSRGGRIWRVPARGRWVPVTVCGTDDDTRVRAGGYFPRARAGCAGFPVRRGRAWWSAGWPPDGFRPAAVACLVVSIGGVNEEANAI
jgi:hypothetical protein